MQVKEKYTNLEKTEAIQSYLLKRVNSLNKFISENSALCEVELEKTTNHHKGGDIFRAEINLAVGGKQFRSVSEKEDLYAAIDVAKDDLVRELQANKDKKVSMVRRGGAKVKNMIKGFFTCDNN